MPLDHDCRFILSLGQTLVNKYNESPDIIDKTMEIIQKFTALKKAYINNTKIAIGSLQETSQYLNGIQNTINNNHQIVSDIFNKPKNIVEPYSHKPPLDFDSIDMDALLGNK